MKAKNYSGSYDRKEEKQEYTYDWAALIIWLFSLVVSLIPMYIEILRNHMLGISIDAVFWAKYLIKGDLLWLVATVLLFVLVDSNAKKRKKTRAWIKNTSIAGLTVFLITEVTWLFFNIAFSFIELPEDIIWALYIGGPLILISLVICTPLKLEFIRTEV